MSVNTDALRRPAASRPPSASRRLPLRYASSGCVFSEPSEFEGSSSDEDLRPCCREGRLAWESLLFQRSLASAVERPRPTQSRTPSRIKRRRFGAVGSRPSHYRCRERRVFSGGGQFRSSFPVRMRSTIMRCSSGDAKRSSHAYACCAAIAETDWRRAPGWPTVGLSPP